MKTIYKNALIHREPCVITPEVLKNAIKEANSIGRKFLENKA